MIYVCINFNRQFYLQINNKSNQCYFTNCCINSGEGTCHSVIFFYIVYILLRSFKNDEDPIDTSIDTSIEPAQEPEDTQDPNDIDADGDGLTPNEGDCDDSNADIQAIDEDGDGFSACDNDCDDTDAYSILEQLK